MTSKTEFAEPGVYLDLQKARELGGRYRVVGEIEKEVAYKDVEDLLDVKSASDLLEMVERYAFFTATQEGELAYDFDKDVARNKEDIEKDIRINSIGYHDMRQHMLAAIKFKELLGRDRIGLEDLAEAGIQIEESPESHLETAREMKACVSKAQTSLRIMTDPLLSECKELCDRLALPFFSCRLSVGYSKTPYSEHLLDGMVRATNEDGTAFALEKSEIGYSFDVVCDHFPNSSTGYRAAVAKALDTLFRINLADVSVATHGGILAQRFLSVYAAFWYHLARGLEGGRAMRCEACSKPLIAFGERGMKRRYCSEACRKWAQRHPGEKRSSYRR